MLRKFGKYLVHISCILVGFYIMGVVVAISEDYNASVIDTLNKLGIFLSSVGVVAAILTIIQQQYLKDSLVEQQEIKEATMLQFKLRNLITVCNSIKVEAELAVKNKNSFHPLLDGVAEDYLFDLKIEEFTFISRMDHTVYSELYYSTYNYNRYIVGMFRWQKNQQSNNSVQNSKHFNERMELLKKCSQSIVMKHHHLAALLNTEYPDVEFYHAEVHPNFFSNLPCFE